MTNYLQTVEDVYAAAAQEPDVRMACCIGMGGDWPVPVE
jgi:hypothetical protein